MAWIESHSGLSAHPKTRKAAQLLGIPRVHMVGHLHALWHWAITYAEFGDLSDFDAMDLALAAEWEGDPKEFVDALADCGSGSQAGFLERDGLYGPPEDRQRGDLVLHDWWDYAGKLVYRRWQDRQRKRRERQAESDGQAADVPEMSDGQATDGPRATGTRTGAPATHPPDQPDQTNQDRAAEAAQIDEDFEDFWGRYPRGPAGKPGGDGAKKPARAKWGRLNPAERGAALTAVDNYRAHIELPATPNAAHVTTWLNQERWEQWQDPAEPQARDGPQAGVDSYRTGRGRALPG